MEDLQVGQRVQFREILEPGDNLYPMFVMELRGPRVLVQTQIPGWNPGLYPTQNYLIEDLEILANQ